MLLTKRRMLAMWIAVTIVVVTGTALLARNHSTNNAQEESRLGLLMVTNQPGSPITPIAGKSTLAAGPFTEVTLRNDSGKNVAGLKLGLFVISSDGARRSLFRTYKASHALAPNATVTVKPEFATFPEFEHLARTWAGGELQLGVLEVSYADQSPWTFDVEAKKGFVTSARGAAAEGAACSDSAPMRAVRFVLASLPLGGGGYFKCGSTMNPIYCSNDLTSCTNVVCTPGQGCPNQQCDFIAGSPTTSKANVGQ